MSSYARTVGERIRAIRIQKGLSLHDVEQQSSKEFKASVLGAYERGERSISVPRLQRLAEFYQVPVDRLLPRGERTVITLEPSVPVPAQERGVRIDLERLKQVHTPETDVITRYLNMIQMARGDFNGKMLTVRSDDVRTLAAVCDLTVDELTAKLEELGLRLPQLI